MPSAEQSPRVCALLCLLGLLGGGVGCHGKPEERIENRTVTVACARCVFHMPDVQGCPLAVEIDHKHYFVRGSVPMGLDAHAPDGTCNMPRKAVVDGEIHGDGFVATRLDMLPAENVPAHPKYTPADQH